MKKLHFMHIQKTGGLSLSYFLEKHFKPDEICRFAHLRSTSAWSPKWQIMDKIHDKKNLSYNFFRGHLGWVPRMLFSNDEIETITFLRNPIDRAISYFNYRKGNINFTHPDNYANRWNTFDDFVFDKELGLEIRENLQTRMFCADLFFQKSFFVDPPSYSELESWPLTTYVKIDLTPKQMLDLAIERLNLCEFVGITENYEESFNQLCMQYKLLPPRTIPRENASRIIITKNEISKKTQDRVVELHNLDLILYNEAVKIFEERKKFRISFNRNFLEKEFININPPSEEVNFKFGGKFTGEGWSQLEGEKPNFFCWSNSKLSTLIFSIKKQKNLLLSFKIIHTILSNFAEKLKVYANFIYVDLTVNVEQDGSLIFKGVIPEEAFSKAELCEITFIIPELISPKDISVSTDVRHLGFALSELEIKRHIF